MIFKVYELAKIDVSKNKYFLFYGENQGHKNEVIQKFKKSYSESIYQYDESEILNNIENFFNTILNKSFFENTKLIVINRSTDKMKDIIEEVIEKKIEDSIFILNSNTLEKKSNFIFLYFEGTY